MSKAHVCVLDDWRLRAHGNCSSIQCATLLKPACNSPRPLPPATSAFLQEVGIGGYNADLQRDPQSAPAPVLRSAVVKGLEQLSEEDEKRLAVRHVTWEEMVCVCVCVCVCVTGKKSTLKSQRAG